MKRLMATGLILVCHAAVFVGIYFGRINGLVMCGSDIALFVIPFVVATAAYAAVFFRMIQTQNVWTRGMLVAIICSVAGAISTIVGMAIAFNLWGT